MENLQRANDQAHALLETLYIDALEAVLGHRVEQARKAFAEFEAAVDTHLREENEHLVPRLTALGETAGRAVGNQVDGHQGILKERLADTRRILSRLDPESPSLGDEVIDALEMLWRVRQTLQQYGARERRMLYPRLNALLPASERTAAVRRLTTICHRYAPGGAVSGATA